MSVDLRTHEGAMKAASAQVTSNKDDTDWALFGYDGQTNTLKLVGTGEDGVTELADDFNPSKVQYALLRVEDPKTSLPKFVLIIWQGETVPGSRKGVCAMHTRDVEKFFVGHHLTMTVRNEDDMDLEQIMAMVNKASSTTYNFKEKPKGMELSPKPVGTSYKKIVPSAELPNIQIRESFWQKDQSEEKLRLVGERERRVLELRGVEEQRRSREEQESRVRDEQIKERERVVESQRRTERSAERREQEGGAGAWQEQRAADARDAEERASRSEVMRRERKEEAQMLIQQGGGDAKKVFQRNSSQGQMYHAPPPRSGAPAPIQLPREVQEERREEQEERREEQEVRRVEQEERREEQEQRREEQEEQKEVQANDIAPPPPAFDNSSPVKEEEVQVVHRAPEVVHSAPEVVNSAPEEVREEEGVHHASVVTVTGEGGSEGGQTTLESYGTCAVALYDYQASDETEISFDPGQIVSHIDQIDPGWWQGLGPQGNYGLFPANYVEVIDNQELQIM